MSRRDLPRSVWLLGWASLFTDAATEMIYPLLPVYLSQVLGAGALSLGVIEGVAEAVNSVLKVVSGQWADRLAKRRPLVILGYALSSTVRPLVALAGTWPQVLLVRVLDRTGKGIRGAPRDAILAGLARAEERGRVFGFHSAMDHAGAIVGPIVATAVLFAMPGSYRLLFSLTAIPGAMAVLVLWFVQEPAPPAAAHARPDTEAQVKGRRLPRRLLAFLAVLVVFGLGNSADAFLLLRLASALGSATWVPLLWAGLHVVKSSLATWGGSLSDRVGRKALIVAGWSVYAVVYFGFAFSTRPAAFLAWFLVYGAFFALSEGAEKALIADLAPADVRGRAFGYYNAAWGISALLASVIFGAVYQWYGPAAAFIMGASLAGGAALLLLCVPIGQGTAAELRVRV
jgi:MFS family permease